MEGEDSMRWSGCSLSFIFLRLIDIVAKMNHVVVLVFSRSVSVCIEVTVRFEMLVWGLIV